MSKEPRTAQSRAPDAIVVGAGLSGIVAAAELIAAGKQVAIVEQESEKNLGGQAWWSFGGLFLTNSPEQRRMGIKDSVELARQDWFGMHGYRALEGTFLGGCLFSGRSAGRSVAGRSVVTE
ncbi:hypothetical protein A20C1_04821 [marine actinobacterium PHSC20C1]|nr:hypothetical protein A20C1_04821 [marine actinobacterium PHSC20C1]